MDVVNLSDWKTMEEWTNKKQCSLGNILKVYYIGSNTCMYLYFYIQEF